MPNQSPVTTTTDKTELSPRLEKLFGKIDPRRGRLIFARDATLSRQPKWDHSTQLEGQMFEEVAKLGGLDVQLVYHRGGNECVASRWMSDIRALGTVMKEITCRGGHTQIRRVFDHVRKEHQKQKVDAVIYVGDACEEVPGVLYEAACCSVPHFVFQECEDPEAREIFTTIANLTGGAYVELNSNSAVTLGELLRAVASYAAGGLQALTSQNSEAARLLLTQMKKK